MKGEGAGGEGLGIPDSHLDEIGCVRKILQNQLLPISGNKSVLVLLGLPLVAGIPALFGLRTCVLKSGVRKRWF